RKSWREATIISRLDPNHWRAEYPGGGSGMFREADIRAYDAERNARPAAQSRRAKATTPQNSSRSRYAIDPETITAGRLPQRAPVVTSAANPHYQKHFDRLFDLAKAGDWDGVRRLFRRPEGDRGGIQRAGLVYDRRPRPDRRGRLSPRHRAQEGGDQPRRPQHPSGPHRGAGAAARCD